MKDELINLIQPNCLLPFSYMALWIDSVLLVNDPTGGVKQQIKAGLRSNGMLTQASWKLLINNAEFEALPPINIATGLEWIEEQGNPTCSQLKVFINTFKIGTLQYFQVQTPTLDMVELNIKTRYIDDYTSTVWEKRVSHVDGSGHIYNMQICLMGLYISNFDLIKDCKPYLVLERYLPKRKNGSAYYQDANDPEVYHKYYKTRRSGWKRDRLLKNLDGQYFDGWSGQGVPITFNNMYRPNFIPLTSDKMNIDIYAENYVRNSIKGNKNFKSVSGNTNAPNAAGNYNIKVPMRARIGAKIGGKEIFSKPLIYFSIFAKVLYYNNRVEIQFSK